MSGTYDNLIDCLDISIIEHSRLKNNEILQIQQLETEFGNKNAKQSEMKIFYG